jgi:hypothetical protein
LVSTAVRARGQRDSTLEQVFDPRAPPRPDGPLVLSSPFTPFGENVPVPGATAALLLLGQRQKLEAGEERGKAGRKRTDPAEGEPLPLHSFHTLLGDLATLTRNVVRLGRDRLTAILATPTPTRTQHRALDLLGVTPTALDRQTPLTANFIDSLYLKAGKVRI